MSQAYRLPELGVDQTAITKIFVLFLRKIGASTEVISKFEGRIETGLCAGFAMLWGMSELEQSKPKKFISTDNPGCVIFLQATDQISSLTEAMKIAGNRSVANILFLQPARNGAYRACLVRNGHAIEPLNPEFDDAYIEELRQQSLIQQKIMPLDEFWFRNIAPKCSYKRRDKNWFIGTLELIFNLVKWDENSKVISLNEKIFPLVKDIFTDEAAEVKQFIDQIDLLMFPHEKLQQTIGQHELHITLQAAQGMHVDREFFIASAFTIETIQKILHEVVRDNKLVSISSGKHTMSIFKIPEQNKFIFYDPNNPTGEMVVESVCKLAMCIVMCGFFGEIMPDQTKNFLFPLIISVFSVDGKLGNYPGKNTILGQDASQKIAKLSLIDGNTRLIMAVKGNDLEVVSILLATAGEKIDAVTKIEGSEFNALQVAIVYNRPMIMQAIISYYKVKFRGQVDASKKLQVILVPALLFAVKQHNLAAVNILITSGANPNLPQFQPRAVGEPNLNAVLLAIQYRKFDIATAIIQKSRPPIAADVVPFNIAGIEGADALAFLVVQGYRHGSGEFAQMLIEAGANPNIITSFTCSVLHILNSCNPEQSKDFLSFFNQKPAGSEFKK